MLQKEREFLDALEGGFKLDFNDAYKDSKLLAEIVDDEWDTRYNNQFGRIYFPLSEDALNTNASGASLYEITMRKKSGPTNAYARAKYSDLPSKGYEGEESRTGSIGNFADGFKIEGKDKQKIARRKKLENELGKTDAPLYLYYIEQMQKTFDAHNMTLNFLAAQKMSYTRMDNTSADALSWGITRTSAYEVDAEHRDMACGDKTWDDSTATIVDDIKSLVKRFRDETGYAGAISLKMETDFYNNVYLANDQVKELVTNYVLANGTVLPNGYMPTSETYNSWNSSVSGGYLPPIELVEQESLILGIDGKPMVQPVSGWRPGIMVISPAGAQGKTLWDINEEYDSMEGMADYAITTVEGGFLTVMNKIKQTGRLPEWSTEVTGDYEPVLDEWLFHWCINTKKAEA